MAKQQKVVRIGADVRRQLANVARLKMVPGRLEKIYAKRLARLRRNHPDKAR